MKPFLANYVQNITHLAINNKHSFIHRNIRHLFNHNWWRVWRCQRGNQNAEIEGQTTQWPKEKGQED